MDSITTITINAMFYAFFVAFSGFMGIVAAALIGFKMYKRMITPKANKKSKTTMVKGAMR